MLREAVNAGEIVNLNITVSDMFDNLIDADFIPSVEILDGLVVIRPSSSLNVVHLSLGKYGFPYLSSSNMPSSVLTDKWNVVVEGFLSEMSFSFFILGLSQPCTGTGTFKINISPPASYGNPSIIAPTTATTPSITAVQPTTPTIVPLTRRNRNNTIVKTPSIPVIIVKKD